MANDQSSHLGIRPLRNRFGFYQVNYYRANTGKDIFLYQPVVRNNSGQVQVAAVGVDASGILGVAVGFLDTNKASLPSGMTALDQGAYLPSSTDAYVAVADDPNQLFVAEADTGGTQIGTALSAGQTIHFTYLATTGNTTTGIANALLDASTLAADTGGIFTLIDPWDIVNQDGTTNDVTVNFAKWVVKINAHQNTQISGYKLVDRPS